MRCLKEIDIGDFVGAKGVVFRTKSSEPTIRTKSINDSVQNRVQRYPKNGTGWATLKYVTVSRYLDLISNENVRKLSVSAVNLSAQLEEYGRTRLSGSGNTYFTSGRRRGRRRNRSRRIIIPWTATFFSVSKRNYTLKRLIIGGFDKVYELGPYFPQWRDFL